MTERFGNDGLGKHGLGRHGRGRHDRDGRVLARADRSDRVGGEPAVAWPSGASGSVATGPGDSRGDLGPSLRPRRGRPRDVPAAARSARYRPRRRTPMTGHRSRWLPWTVLVTASLLLVGSAAFAASGLWQRTSVTAGAAARPAAVQPTAGQPTASAAVPGTGRTGLSLGPPRTQSAGLPWVGRPQVEPPHRP